MEYKNIISCQYCGVTQTILGEAWLCSRCGAPIRLEEKTSIPRIVLSKIDKAILSSTDWSEGIDVSKWQGDMNWSVAKPLIDYTIIKASENIWEDEKYARNVDECLNKNIQLGVYHFCRPQYDWREQAAFFASRVTGSLPAFADLEVTGGLTPTYLERWIHNFVDEVQNRSGYTVGIYTRASFWDLYVARNGWAYRHPLWVAHFNSYITQPKIPYDWFEWKFWQWSADGNGEGSLYGAQSNSIDKNRFNGNTDQLYEWIGVNLPAPEPVNCTRYRVLVDTLNIRSGPGISYRDIGDLHRGDTVDIVDIAGKDTWIEIEPGKFVAHTYGGYRYLEKVK